MHAKWIPGLKPDQVKHQKVNLTIFQRNVPGITGILLQKKVGIAGLGGLGSNAAVSLVRSGVGKLILADFDDVEFSNLNRQFYFLADVGKKKTQALSQHLNHINPGIQLELYTGKLTRKNIPFIFNEADLLIEAFDRAEDKAWLIEIWADRFPDRPIVCASGLGGYGNTGSLKVVQSGNIYICGDGESDMCLGLSASRIAIVANMQVNVAVEILINREKKR